MAVPILVAGIGSGLVASGVAVGSGAGIGVAAVAYAAAGMAAALATSLMALRCRHDRHGDAVHQGLMEADR